MNDKKEIVAQRLKELLESRALSQSELAEKCSLTKDTVSKIINGKMALSVTSALKIANAFGVSLDYLFGLSEFENASHYAYSIQKRHLCFCPWSYSETSPKFPVISASTPFVRYWDAIYKSMTIDLPDDIRENWIARNESELKAALQEDGVTGRETFILVPVENITDDENYNRIKILLKKQ